MHQKKKLEKYFTSFHISIFGLLAAFILTFTFKFMNEDKLHKLDSTSSLGLYSINQTINQISHLNCPDWDEAIANNEKYKCTQVIARNPSQLKKLKEKAKQSKNILNPTPEKVSATNFRPNSSQSINAEKSVSSQQVDQVINEKCSSFDNYMNELKININELPFSRINEKDLKVIVKNNSKIYKATLVATCAKESLSLQEICSEGGRPIVSNYLNSPSLKKFLISESKVNEQKRELASVNDFEMQSRLVEVAFTRAMRVCQQLGSIK